MDVSYLNKFNNSVSQVVLEADRLGELLGGLGFDLDTSSGKMVYRGACPVHGGDGDGFVLKLEGHSLPIRWACWSEHCEKKYVPNLLGLVRGLLSSQVGKDVGVKKAVDYLKEFLGSEAIDQGRAPTTPSSPPPRLKLSRWTRTQVRSRLLLPSQFFVKRGFSPAVLDDLDVGYSDVLKRSVVPLYDDQGEFCIGFVARSHLPSCTACGKHHVGPDCKYGQAKWVVQSGFPKGACLYNYAAARRSSSPFVLLVEGAPDVFRATEADYPAVALLGTDLSATQVQKLAALKKTVVVALDNDEAGRAATVRVHHRLRRTGLDAHVWHVPDAVKDLGEMSAEAIKNYMDCLGERDAELDAILGLPPTVLKSA